MSLNVGINGFGRIGRIIFRSCFQNPRLKVSAINDPAVDIDYVCYLIKFDSTHGKFRSTVNRSDNEITIDGHKIAIFKEKLPTNIPWQIADVQYVVEASGMFTSLEKASGHLASEGVKRVLVTSPSLDVPMVVLGVNEDKLSTGHKVISCASSTLYCLAPIIKILEDQYGVSEGFITSIHAMTPSLKPLDGLCLKGKHWRDHRSIHQNIIPATTGACRALGRIIPQVKDKITGLAFRVPIVNVSVLDITIRLKSQTSMEDIVKQVEIAGNASMQNIIRISKEQAVSSDFIGDTFSCILDLDSSLQLTPDFFKLICWYENEYSYACRIMDSIFFMERQYQIEWKSKISYIRSTSKTNLRESYNKFTYHKACSYDCHSDPKSLCSTSQDSGFKSTKRLALAKKNLPLRNLETRTASYSGKESKKKELFKILNDENETVKAPLQQNTNTFLYNCSTIKPQFNSNTYVKTRERLENVKREFSKMVIMTENLLKQSQQSKLDIGLSQISSNVSHPNIEKIQLCEETKLSVDKNNRSITPSKSNDNDCKKIIENNNTSTENDERNKNNTNTFPINRDLINDVTNNDVCNRLINNEKSSYDLDKTNSNKINSSPALMYTKDINNENYTLNKKYESNSVIDNSRTYTKSEKLTIANNNVVQVLISNSDCKKQNDCQNHTIDTPLSIVDKNGITQIENDEHKQNEYLNNKNQEQEKSCSLTKQSESSTSSNNNAFKIVDSDKRGAEQAESQDKPERNLRIRLEGVLKKLAIDSNVVSEKPSLCLSYNKTVTTPDCADNRDIKDKQDIYDKLDSVSATDSENSFHMKERKSQVINITDLTNSLEDLEQLDKICRIIEISDELSDQLLSALNSTDRNELKNKKWSFKDLCEKIKLDDFCNKMYAKNNV